MIKRLFDIIFSIIGLILLLPFLVIIAVLIKLDSKGSPIFQQTRVGKHKKDFKIFKFRTMHLDSHKKGLLTLGNNDVRVTKIGRFLRRYKIDEFPQLLNIFIGNMSFVGPRPEVRKYVAFYSEEDDIIFTIKPGITDNASVVFKSEAELLKASKTPETYFIDTILPEKLILQKKYVKHHNLLIDINIILKTCVAIFVKKSS